MKRIALLLVMPLAVEAQTTINGGRVIKGTLDASGAISTLPYRTGSGSPAGRDTCGKPGEAYFQTDAPGGQNVWGCTAAGIPGTWNQLSAGATVATGTTAPSGSCSAGALYVRTDVRQFYICSAANVWQLGSYGSDVLANRPVSCAAGQVFLATDLGTLSFCVTPGNPGSWQAVGGAIGSVFGRTGAVTAQAGDYTAAQVTNAAQTNAGNTFTAGAQDFSQAAHTLPAKVGNSSGEASHVRGRRDVLCKRRNGGSELVLLHGSEHLDAAVIASGAGTECVWKNGCGGGAVGRLHGGAGY